ncbi:2-aminoethylphosphonate ABC transporter substrate-binding protein [Streptomyces cacaoi]|uniref:2-aminoethylphosphonate ABC transporter substrate-binding protein n=1 Tax=Streptomyces cacaoi TaxID=1898 RepID=A0A4Y3R0Y5_STRCI|nr:2-aminoethylphosphonate ABC transporter substrate-binding protein [Streptomyces cacaoi]NNG84465.1 2-aminoethylphosphonate ABC transporter substrate-binding protein [Streptomyces cacaoi]GEB51355.1 2-aminoethylphosphonate ABC transporter substrate-binding protein [Streptomyces cacaoi]
MSSSHRGRSAVAAAGALVLALVLTGCGGTGTASSGDEVVTVYSADGLKGENGDGWYDEQFAAFERKTGIKVEYVEGGSGEMVQRTEREKANTQADVLVTLPPFIQQADSKGLLTAYRPEHAEHIPAGERPGNAHWTPVVNNYFGFVHNTAQPPAPTAWQDLLKPRYRDKVQYSTPGVAGDGTALVIQAIHDFGGREAAMEYLGKLQKNNVGPSSSTSKLAPKVDKGELLAANGDVQMNYAQSRTMPHLGLWFPAAKKGAAPSTFALPYTAGLVKGAPHGENGKKLLDFLLSRRAQEQVSSVGGGFTVREDITADDANAQDLRKLMKGVKVFRPDWSEVARNLDSYIDDWKKATGS